MKFCPKCGAELKPEAKFCAACGTPIVAATTPPPVEPTPQPQPVYQQQEPVYEHARAATGAFKEAITGNTNLVQRVINILTKSGEEWFVIANEKPDKMKLLFGYVFILSLIPAIISLVTYTIINSYAPLSFVIIQTIISFALTITVLFVMTFIIDALAPSFESEKNFEKSFQFICYALTPIWIISILFLIPDLTIIRLAQLAGFGYFTYLALSGLSPIKGTPKTKVVGFAALLGISIMVLYYLLEWLLRLIFIRIILGYNF